MLTFEDMAIVWFGPRPIGEPVSADWISTRQGLVRHLVNGTYLPSTGRSPRADEITRATFWQAQRYGRALGLSPATINHITHSVPPAMYRDLEEEGLLPRGSHAELLRVLKRVKRLRVPKFRRERALTIEQRDDLLEHAREDPYAALFHVLFLSGLRIGEACGLLQKSIDWKRRLCTIVFTRKYQELGQTKTANSERIIRLPRAAIAALAPYRREDVPDAPLLTSEKGMAVDQHNFRRRHWKPVVVNAGLPLLTPHHARHTFATNCLERGVYPAPLAAYLGHTVDVLLKKYGHVLGDFDVDEVMRAPGVGALRRVGGRDVADLGF